MQAATKTDTDMKLNIPLHPIHFVCGAGLCALLAGCASPGENVGAGAGSARIPSKYTSKDNRSIEIGKSWPADGGVIFKEPHMEKCWIADGFNFAGYDTLYIAPSLSTVKVHDDQQKTFETAREQ